MAEIVCYIYIFHLTWPMSLHYLVKGRRYKLLRNTGFVTIRLLRFGVKVTRAYCRDNFLAQRPLPDMSRLSGDNFFVFQQNGTPAHQHMTPLRSWSEIEMPEMCSRLSVCACVRGAHFEHEFWQFWAYLSWQLITLLNKPCSIYCVLIQSSHTLLQIIHFNIM